MTTRKRKNALSFPIYFVSSPLRKYMVCFRIYRFSASFIKRLFSIFIFLQEIHNFEYELFNKSGISLERFELSMILFFFESKFLNRFGHWLMWWTTHSLKNWIHWLTIYGVYWGWENVRKMRIKVHIEIASPWLRPWRRGIYFCVWFWSFHPTRRIERFLWINLRFYFSLNIALFS